MRKELDGSSVCMARCMLRLRRFYEQYLALRARIKASSCPTLHRCHPATPTHTNVTTTRSASLRETHRYTRTLNYSLVLYINLNFFIILTIIELLPFDHELLFFCCRRRRSRRKEVKLNLELTRVPQGSNPTSPTSPSSNKLSAAVPTPTPATTSIATATTTTSPVPANQIRRYVCRPLFSQINTSGSIVVMLDVGKRVSSINGQRSVGGSHVGIRIANQQFNPEFRQPDNTGRK